MKSKVIFCLFAMGLSSAAVADGAPTQTFTYRVEVPSLQISCVDHAVKVAHDFAQATQLTVTGAGCTGTRTIQEGANQFSIDTIVISYVAATQVDPVRANYSGYEYEGIPDTSSGLFATYAACYAELSHQEALFAANTGLAVVDLDCDLSSDLVYSGYSMVVESFGKPAALLFEYSQSPDADSSRSSAEFQSAQNVILASGGQVAYMDSTHILYYSQHPIPVFTTYLAFFPVASECEQQITSGQEALVSGHYDGLNVFCSVNEGGNTALTAVGAGVNMINAVTNSDVYASFTDCMNDRARVAANDGPRVTAEICRPRDGSSSQYVVDVYSSLN